MDSGTNSCALAASADRHCPMGERVEGGGGGEPMPMRRGEREREREGGEA